MAAADDHGDHGSYTESPELLKELVKQVATHIGPFARPGMIVGTPGLPKTRSGEYVLWTTVLAGVVCVQFWLMVVRPAVDGVEFPLCL